MSKANIAVLVTFLGTFLSSFSFINIAKGYFDWNMAFGEHLILSVLSAFFVGLGIFLLGKRKDFFKRFFWQTLFFVTLILGALVFAGYQLGLERLRDDNYRISLTNTDLHKDLNDAISTLTFNSVTIQGQSTRISELVATVQDYELVDQEIPECESRNKPEKPCWWRVQSGDSYDSVASQAYGSYSYALVVLNFNRTPSGYRGPTPPILFLPDIGNPSPRSPVFPEDKYDFCTPAGHKPCLYQTRALDTFESIAEEYYGLETAGACINIANYFYDEAVLRFLNIPENEINKITLILPESDSNYCDF